MRTWITIGTVAVVACAAMGEVLRVPQDYPNIQAAVDVAVRGDTVLLADGFYRGSGNRNILIKKNITVTSENGPDFCTIDCMDRNRAFRLRGKEGKRGPTISGIKIWRGKATLGGAINIVGSATVADCIIRQCIAGSGGAIFARGGPILIKDCTIIENFSRFWGGAAMIGNGVTMSRCTIVRNIAGHLGGGVASDGGGVTIIDCSITNNRASSGGGLYQDRGYDNRVENCRITGNSAELSGGGAFMFGDCTFVGCTFVRNALDDPNRPGGAIQAAQGRLDLLNSILWDNSPTEILKGFRLLLVVSHCNIQGGWPGEGNIDADPLFVTGPRSNYYLSHRKSGQDRNSPCVNAGVGKGKKLFTREFTTRTDGKRDKRAVDMGVHWGR